MKRFTIVFLLVIFSNTHFFSQAIHNYSDIFFLDDHNGWILSTNGYLWKTTNAGTDWIRIYDSRIDTSGNITFVDEQNGWLILSNTLLRSSNGGLDWVQEYEFPLVFGGYDIEFTNDSIGFAFTYNKLYKSVDCGETWGLVTDTLHNIYDISFYKDSIGYLCFTINTPYFPTSTRYIYKTTDKGETWSRAYIELGYLQVYVYFDKICIINTTDCIISAFEEHIFGGSSSLIKTTDSGATWNPLYISPVWPLDFEFISPQIGWSISGSGIIKTTDEGMSWDTLQTFTNWDVRNTNFEFFNSKISYLINLNHIYYTDDGWVTYSIVDSIVTDVNKLPNPPTEYSLEQNYPNPFNPSTKISWQSPISSWQSIKLYDAIGREIETIFDGFYEAGIHTKSYIANATLPSGIYFYQLKAGNFVQTKKMMLIK
jgi:photosystem II stability/assembly factor-like uncharacterized protein